MLTLRLSLSLLCIFACNWLFVLAAPSNNVFTLDDDTFESEIHSGRWLVLFTNPDLEQHEDKLQQLKQLSTSSELPSSEYKFGVVDCDDQPDPCLDLEIPSKSLPSVRFWEEQSRKWTELAAELNADAVLEWINHFLHGDVVVLTKENFQLSVSDGRVWLVEYYAPWCFHCKQLAPVWKEIASEQLQKGDFVVAKVDAVAENELASKAELSGYPTIKLHKNGEIYTYIGDRSKKSFYEFVANPEEYLQSQEPEEEEDDEEDLEFDDEDDEYNEDEEEDDEEDEEDEEIEEDEDDMWVAPAAAAAPEDLHDEL